DDAASGGGASVVPLVGRGISRQVAASLTTIDLGITAVGVPVLLSERVAEALALTNTSADPFRVRPLELVGDVEAFRLVDGADARDLPADASTHYDLEFAPAAAGEYDAILRVYLDDDPDAHVQLAVRGWAVDTRAHGGGCATGG